MKLCKDCDNTMTYLNKTKMKHQNYYDPSNKEDAFWSALISMTALVAFVFVAWLISFL